MNDALDKLIVDENGDTNLDLLYEIVSKYLKFTRTGEIIFEKEFYNLKDWHKILIYLIGRKVILIKKLQQAFDEKISPKDISEVLKIPSKSITKYYSRELKRIIKSEKGKYYVQNYNLYKCKEVLGDNGRKTIKR